MGTVTPFTTELPRVGNFARSNLAMTALTSGAMVSASPLAIPTMAVMVLGVNPPPGVARLSLRFSAMTEPALAVTSVISCSDISTP